MHCFEDNTLTAERSISVKKNGHDLERIHIIIFIKMNIYTHNHDYIVAPCYWTPKKIKIIFNHFNNYLIS